MNTPSELKYSRTHEWVRFTGESECEVGLTDFAQDALGDLVVDGEYAAFGKVVEGLDTVDEIASCKTGFADKPVTPQIMKKVYIED